MAPRAAAAGQDAAIYVRERSQEFPLGRIAPPSYLTGITITVDGGITRGVYL